MRPVRLSVTEGVSFPAATPPPPSAGASGLLFGRHASPRIHSLIFLGPVSQVEFVSEKLVIDQRFEARLDLVAAQAADSFGAELPTL